MCHQVAGGLGKQYLPTVPGAHDAGSTMHIQANIALGGELRLTSVQPYTYTHCCTLRPGMAGKSALSIGCCGDSISSAGEDDEECVTLGVDLLPEIHAERHTQELAALRQQVCVGITQLLEQVCGSLDIREEQCDCSGRQVTHIKYLFVIQLYHQGFRVKQNNASRQWHRFPLHCSSHSNVPDTLKDAPHSNDHY